MIEASPDRDPARNIARALHRSLREAQGRPNAEPRLRKAIAAFKSFTLGIDPAGNYSFRVEVDANKGVADSGDLADDLTDLLAEIGMGAVAMGVGVMLLIDEMQDLPESTITALNQAMHHLGQGSAPLPVMLIGAGLPSLPGILARVTTYAERLFEYRPVQALAPDSAADALIRPSENLGVVWDDEAVEITLAASRGYPFAIQQCGKFVWDYAVASPITRGDAEVGIARAREEMDSGIYLSRWLRATPAQRELMRAVAGFGEGASVPVGEMAKVLGKSQQSLSVAREALIEKGLLYPPDRGFLAFTVPGMADYINRLPDS